MVAPPTIELGNIGMADSLILMVLALVVFGPRKLPQIGRQIGKLMYEFRKASNDFKFQMEEELRIAEDADRRKKEEDRQKALAPQLPQESVSAPPPATVNAIESPYSGEQQYPETKAAETSQPEESVPKIMPPSTGEQVAASRPGRYAEPASEAAAPAPNGSGAAESAPAKEESVPASETVSRNG
jgi:sec-independent protein translocase protein TatB